jgi:hypothetical protein
MSGRQDIEAAFSPDGASQIPCVICYEGIFVRDHWSEIVPFPWWYQFSPEVQQQLSWRRAMITTIGQDFFYLPSCPSREERKNSKLEFRSDGIYRINFVLNQEEKLNKPRVGGWSVSGGSESIQPVALAQTPAEIDKQIKLSDQIDLSRVKTEGRNDLARALLEEFGAHLFPIRHETSPLSKCYDLWGFEGLMIMVATRPDLVQYACRRFVEQSKISLRYSAFLGAAGIWLEEFFTDMICPEAFAKLNVPYVSELIDEIRSLELKSIYYFCGNPAGKLDLLLATGADGLAFEESKKGFVLDIENIARKVHGKRTILGNLDAIHLLPSADEQALRAGIQRQIDAARENGNRFILSLRSPVTPGTSVERVQLYLRLGRKLGR